MLRSTAGKVAWVGRTASMVFGLALVLALIFGVATTALAAIPGDPFRLGQTNGIDAMSTLVGNVAGTMLRVDNNSTGAGATALDLRVEPGKAPMKVNSATRVALLNADKVDGKDSTAFLGKSEIAADSDTLDGKDSTAFLGTTQKAADSDKLDGKDSTAFYAAGSKVAESSHADRADSATTAADADTLDDMNSSEFLTKTGTAADSNMLDGKDSSAFAAAYKRTAVVSPTGTDIQNGTALLGALNGITDASATKKYLIYIEPGTYDLGSSTLRMKQYVDIQGSGELNTLITSVASGCTGGTLSGANNTELRFLTVQNTATGMSCDAAIVNDSASPRLTHVTAKATGSGGVGTKMGVHNSGSSAPTMTDVTATASGGFTNVGVNNQHSSAPTMIDVTATASGGTENNGVSHTSTSSYTIKQSTLRGNTYSLYKSGNGNVKVALTQLVGPLSSGLACFNNYNDNMAAVTCP